MFERSTWQGVEGGLQLIATEVLSPTILNELNPVNNCMSTVGSCLFHSWNCRWDHSHGCDHNLEKDLDMEDSPGKNTGVGCHFLLQCMKVKSEREVVQSYPTLSDPMDCSLPGFFIHRIFQARVLEWGAIAFSGNKKMAKPYIIFFWPCLISDNTETKTDKSAKNL